MNASRKFGVESKMLNGSLMKRNRRDDAKKIWVAKILSLYRCFVNGNAEGAELSFVHCTECVPSLDTVEETSRCVRLRWATEVDEKDESKVKYVVESE